MDILKTINEGDTMLELVMNVLNNIRFYIQHREELADIHITNEYLMNYANSLQHILELYKTNDVPDWFKDTNPYRFMSGSFPYINSPLNWLFSFKDYVDILTDECGYIVDNEHMLTKNGILLTVAEYRIKKKSL